MDDTKLIKIYQGLCKIKEYLRKIGKDRRGKGEILEKKIDEAKDIYKTFRLIIEQIHIHIPKGEIKSEDIGIVNDLINNIKTVYKEILNFALEKTNLTINMSDFDIKIALSLLPVITEKEESVQNLIDAIGLYESMLNNDGKKLLINFVLKTRLSASAKLRLSVSYNTVKELVDDIKKHLVAKKSDTALQMKLLRAKQGDKSIKEFGKELEELFVDLTITQANGDSDVFKILRPINERTAVKRFSDGLRSPKLSTIIAARNYGELKDAIRAAQDEEISSPDTDNTQIMTIGRGRTPYRPNFSHYNRGNPRQFTNSNFSRGRNNTYNNNIQSNNNRSNFSNFNSRPRNNRGGYQNRSINNVYHAEIDTNDQEATNDLNYFFRENCE